MNHWLLKTEPSDYSIDDLLREGQTTWTGVKNAMALIHMRRMKKGDSVLIYHTGSEKAVVGIGKVLSEPRKPPDAASDRDIVVDVRGVRKLSRAVLISELRGNPSLADWDLLRNSRLSVMPAPAGIYRIIVALGDSMAQTKAGR